MGERIPWSVSSHCPGRAEAAAPEPDLRSQQRSRGAAPGLVHGRPAEDPEPAAESESEPTEELPQEPTAEPTAETAEPTEAPAARSSVSRGSSAGAVRLYEGPRYAPYDPIGAGVNAGDGQTAATPCTRRASAPRSGRP